MDNDTRVRARVALRAHSATIRFSLLAVLPFAPALSGLPQTPTVSLEGMEVTQGIQNSIGSVRLIENRDTWVRVFLAGEPGELAVSGTLRIRHRGTGEEEEVPSVLGARARGPARSGARDARLATGLVFALPARFATRGELELELVAVTDSASGVRMPCRGCSESRSVAQFHAGAPLRVRVIGLRYAGVAGGKEYEPTDVDFANTESLLRRMFPAAEVQFSHRTVDLTEQFIDRAEPDTLIRCDYARARVYQLRSLEIHDRLVDERTHYYGMVSAGGYFMRGCGPDNPAGPTTPAAGPTGPHPDAQARPRASGWDVDGSWGDSYAAHELGHTFGRKHVQFGPTVGDGDAKYPFHNAALGRWRGPPDDYVGFDPGDPRLDIPPKVLAGDSWHDVMSYAPWTWVSAYTYDGLLQRLLDEDRIPAAQPPPPFGPRAAAVAALAEQRSPASVWLHEGLVSFLVATVDLTAGTGRIQSLMLLDRVSLGPAEPAGSAVLRVFDTAGNVIRAYPLVVDADVEAVPGGPRTGVIGQAIPHHSEAGRVELLLDGRVVDAIVFSDQQVTVPPPSIGSALFAGSGAELITFTWEAAPPTTAPVHYLLQLSLDGERWRTLATARNAAQLVVRATDVPPGTPLRFRLVATDGIRRFIGGSVEFVR